MLLPTTILNVLADVIAKIVADVITTYRVENGKLADGITTVADVIAPGSPVGLF